MSRCLPGRWGWGYGVWGMSWAVREVRMIDVWSSLRRRIHFPTHSSAFNSGRLDCTALPYQHPGSKERYATEFSASCEISAGTYVWWGGEVHAPRSWCRGGSFGNRARRWSIVLVSRQLVTCVWGFKTVWWEFVSSWLLWTGLHGRDCMIYIARHIHLLRTVNFVRILVFVCCWWERSRASLAARLEGVQHYPILASYPRFQRSCQKKEGGGGLNELLGLHKDSNTME